MLKKLKTEKKKFFHPNPHMIAVQGGQKSKPLLNYQKIV